MRTDDMLKKGAGVLATLAFIVLSHPAHGAETQDYADRLAALRAKVESLSEQVELQREDLRGELRSLEMQKTDLETQVRREELRLTEVSNLIGRYRDELAVQTLSTEVLVPTLVEAMGKLEAQVKAGVPYHADERLGELARLRAQLTEGTLTPPKCASRLWQFVEDELRLARENALDHQVIEVQGDGLRVDVARIGMVAMYFRAKDERYGVAQRADGAWSWSPLADPSEVAQVAALFDSLDAQVRVGFFELPGAVAEVN
jgi:hypothetical protein